MTLNFAIIGAGRIAHAHARALAGAAGVELTAVMDKDATVARKFARTYGAPIHTDDLEIVMNMDQIGATVVCSPTALHHAHGVASLVAGKHTLIEKPFASDVAQATEMADIAELQGLQLMSGQVVRFMPMFELAKAFIDSGRLGTPVQSVERRLTFRRDNYSWWAQLPQFLVSHWGSHSLDLLCHLLDDDVEQVLCSTASIASRFGVVDDFTLQARFQSGFRAAIAMSFTSRFPVHDFVIVGTEATLQFDCYRRVRVNGEVVLDRSEEEMTDEAFDLQLHGFLEAIRGRAALPSSGRSVIRSLEALAAAELSARDDRVVRLHRGRAT
jgi:predicted dehydrogenase